MPENQNWPNAVRVVWSGGGVVAINNQGPEVVIGAGIDGAVWASFTIPSYNSLFAKLRKEGLPTFGATFIQSPEEFDGTYPPEFRAMNTHNGWLLSDMRQQWRGIAHAAGESNEMALFDIASRIASGLNYSEMRLKDLAEAYSVQLRAKARSKKIDKYSRFKDLNSHAVYKSIHALFWELAVLRDVLAEFAALVCFGISKVATMSGLIGSLRKKPYDDVLATQLLRDADNINNGWLNEFSEYRNLFTHSAPMEQAAGIAFTVQDTLTLACGVVVPQIYYPLPANVSELVRKRSSGPLYESFDALANASAGRRPERGTEPDALQYLWACLDKLAELAKVLVIRSPIEPKRMEFGPHNIIGDVQVIQL